MSKTYIIEWKSKANGRTGRGTKLFDQAEAEQLARELNQEYPQIEHHPVLVQSPEPPLTSPSETQESPVLLPEPAAPADPPVLEPVEALPA